MNSIKHKILTFALLASLIPTIGLGALLFRQYEADIDERVRQELHNAAQDVRTELTLWLRERVSDVRALSTAYVLVDGLKPAEATTARFAVGPDEIEHYLRSVQKRVEPVLELTVSAPDGAIVASSAREPALPLLPRTWRDQAVTEGFVLEPSRWDPARATAIVTVIVPLLSLNNELVGALSAVLDLQSVKPRLEQTLGGAATKLLLLAPDGTTLIGTRAADEVLLPAQPSPAWRESAGTTVLKTHDGREMLGLLAQHPSLPVTILVARDRASAFEPWQRTLQVFGAVTACVALLVGCIGYRMGRSIAQPIDGLIVAANGIARGNLDVAIEASPSDEVGRLTKTFNVMAEHLRRNRAHVDAAQRSLQAQNDILEAVASTDALTGVYNRKKLDEVLAAELARFRRHGRPYSLVMLDVDNFKSVNDTYGHAVGDEVLAKVASIVKLCVRTVDVAARYGGEEFVLVLVETEFEAARAVAERIRTEVQRARFTTGAAPLSVTLSAGVAQVHASEDSATAPLQRADEALYRAKREGRNQVQAVA